MSDYIIPLRKTIQRLLVSLRIKPCMIWVPVYPYDFSILYSPSCSLYFQPPGFLLLLTHNKHEMVSGFLNLLNSVPGMLFPKIYTELFQFLHISAQIYFLTEAFFHRKVPLCSLTRLFLHTYSFVYLFSSTRM